MSDIISRTITQHLRCDLTSKEIESYGREIARELSKLAAVEEKKKEIVAQLKAEAEAHKNQALALTRLINNGYEYRDIECTETKNYAQGLYTVVRDDTGEEVANRPLTANERQVEITSDVEPVDPDDRLRDLPMDPEDEGEPGQPGAQ